MELIKIKIKELASKGSLAEEIKNKFLESCINLDTRIFEPLIDENQFFDDENKYKFLQYLHEEFSRVRESGVTETTMRKGICQMCFRGQTSFEFYGKDSKPEFAYVIHKEEDGIEDITKCNASSGYLNAAPNFKELKFL